MSDAFLRRHVLSQNRPANMAWTHAHMLGTQYERAKTLADAWKKKLEEDKTKRAGVWAKYQATAVIKRLIVGATKDALEELIASPEQDAAFIEKMERGEVGDGR